MDVYDLAVIGSGPGGYAAAIRAAQRGVKTVIVEKEDVGGICLNWGCIPTKAIIHSVDTLGGMRTASGLGIEAENVKFDMKKIISRSRDVAGRLSKGVNFLLKKHDIKLVKGIAELKNDRELLVRNGDNDPLRIKAENIIIASGSHPKQLPHIPIDEKYVISSRRALELEELPASLAVIGAGPIGVEFAYIYRQLGVEVTLIEALDSLLPNEDDDVSRELLKEFKKQKIRCLLNSKVSEVTKKDKELQLKIDGAKGENELSVEKILSAVGVVPNSENIGLEECGIKTEKGFISVDEFQETNVKGVYAIGDVAGNPCLAHKATREGLIAVDRILGRSPHPLNKGHIPACTYCKPQVASVGLSEKDAQSKNIEYEISKVNYRAVGKAAAIGEINGFLKCLSDKESGNFSVRIVSERKRRSLLPN
ncbi:MAG: dihydrolipoyl dehydrogenase [Candidatus Marinimicrobia bacterium]|nr:dihydrolipoyl dehydrogenase [Candidatus Neomarinimicrobiota bacterium]